MAGKRFSDRHIAPHIEKRAFEGTNPTVRNAVRTQHGIRIAVKANAMIENRLLTAQVEIGMPRQIHDRVFTRFVFIGDMHGVAIGARLRRDVKVPRKSVRHMRHETALTNAVDRNSRRNPAHRCNSTRSAMKQMRSLIRAAAVDRIADHKCRIRDAIGHAPDRRTQEVRIACIHTDVFVPEYDMTAERLDEYRADGGTERTKLYPQIVIFDYVYRHANRLSATCPVRRRRGTHLHVLRA